MQVTQVYPLSDLRSAYESLKTPNCPSLRSCDIKAALLEKYPTEITIESSVHMSKRGSDYVFPSGRALTPDVMKAASSGFGLSKSAVFRSAAYRLHNELLKRQEKKPRPPSPQDILADKDPFSVDTFNFLAWIIDPHAPVSEHGMVSLKSKRKAKKIASMSHNLESLLPNGQPSVDQVLFSLRLHWKTGAREPVDIASSFGYGIPYTDTRFCEDVWAEWDRAQNSNIPSNINPKIYTTVVADNIDFDNKDIGGSQTHNTNVILIQHTSAKDGSKVSLEPHYDFDRRKHRSFKATDSPESTFHCRKVNPPKFHVEELELPDVQYVAASKKTVAWLLCRRRNVDDKTNIVPAWSAFQSLTSKKPELCEVSVGYHPTIPESPTKYDTIYKVLKTTDDIMKELELGFIFLEVDQAIYSKVMDTKFYLLQEKADNLFDNIIVRMGGFHIIICMMRSIYSRFCGFGFTELLAQIGTMGGPGTIEKGLTGGDVKAGIRLYKILFEALYRIKFRYLENSGVIPESEEMRLFLKQIQTARENLNFEEIEKLVNNPIIEYFFATVEGDMANWIDSFLEMVHLLLNIIHFHRIGDWHGFLVAVFKFLAYIFSLKRVHYCRNLTYHYLDMIDQ